MVLSLLRFDFSCGVGNHARAICYIVSDYLVCDAVTVGMRKGGC